MRLPSVPSLSLVDHLNTVYFNRLWNAADDHGRANFEIYKVADRLQTGAVSVNRSVVGLPTTGTVYAVYKAPYGVFGRFITLTENTWMTDSDILSSQGVTVTAYNGSGRICPRGTVYFRYDPFYDIVVIAIKSLYTKQCIGESYPTLYITVNKDTSRNTPVISNLYTVSTSLGSITTPIVVNNAIIDAKANYPHGTVVVVNGFSYDPNHVPTLVHGDIVQITSDPDIVGYTDISVDDSSTGYYSTMYSEYREVLHIDKSLNPNKVIITNDTVDVMVYDPVTNKGLYGIRIDDHAIESITHNDFSISRSALQNYQNTLGAFSVKVRIYVRFPTRPIYLTGDVNHISDLYSLSDTEISKQLVGLSDNQILEWEAAHLEQSEFLNLLYTFNGFSTTQVLGEFISAMGYYDVASVLSQSVRYHTYVGSQLTIAKPARLVGYECRAIVYADGKKLPEDAFTISDYSDSSFLLGFKSNYYITSGTRLGIYVIEKDERTPQIYNPTSGSPSILMDNEDYSLVEIFHYDTPKTIWNGTASVGYKTIQKNIVDYTVTINSDNTVTYQVKPIHYGKNFYLVPKYGITTDTYPLDTTLSNKDAIIVDLKTTDANTNVIPLIGYTTLEVYLNGFKLVENIDYNFKIINGDNDDLLQLLLVVSNQEYLDLSNTGNSIDIVSHGDAVVSEDKGYAINNLLYRKSMPTLWTPSSGRVFVRGKLIEDVTQNGNVLTTGTNVMDGSPYSLIYTLPYSVSKLMDGFSYVDDNNLQTRIDLVLGLTPPVYPDTVVITDQYALYSPFLAKVTNDVHNGLMTITDEPMDDAFLAQFVRYHAISSSDPTVGASNTDIQRMFVTLAAHYTNLTVSDPNQMIRLQRLISLVLTPTLLTIDEVLL
jgi:hypothetical protein